MSNPYISNTGKIRKKMLEEIGADSVEDLFSDVPDEFLFGDDFDVPEMSENELKRHLKGILGKNSPYNKCLSFLGGGVWPHHVPSVVEYLVRRSEFLTSYSPYQPENSQGMLQALFEYQSLISELTGLGAVNSSVYDWASALGESALMCARLTDRDKFLVPEFISPERLSVLESYATGPGLEIIEVSQSEESGELDISDLESKMDETVAGFYLENPGYLGNLEVNLEEISDICDGEGALFVVGVNPISLGVFKPPASYGADIVVGEGQPLGIPANFGGPLLGIFACRAEEEFLEQIPGRVMGMTKTKDGKTRGFSMALQSREQHISREKATSNLCTTQALNAVSAAIYLSLLGSSGLRNVARESAGNARYAMERLDEIEGVSAPVLNSHHFNEFVVSFEGVDRSVKEINSKLLDRGIHGGKPLGVEFSEFESASLWCTTDIHSKEDIDWMVSSLKEILEE